MKKLNSYHKLNIKDSNPISLLLLMMILSLVVIALEAFGPLNLIDVIRLSVSGILVLAFCLYGIMFHLDTRDDPHIKQDPSKHITTCDLIAMGFDESGKYLLVVTRSGRAVFSTLTWERVAVDAKLAYPKNGMAIGIGPIKDENIHVLEREQTRQVIKMKSPDGHLNLVGDRDKITVTSK